jgi:CheY-like chemotaxis protein
MSYPQYSFQHSVLVISDFGKSEKMIRGGLLSYPVQFEFCPGDYEKAIEKITHRQPDILVVSLEFQIGSVLEFIEKTRKNWAHVPSIFLSEPHLLEIQKAAMHLGATEIVPYPVSEAGELIHKIHDLSLHRARRANFGDEKKDLPVA